MTTKRGSGFSKRCLFKDGYGISNICSRTVMEILIYRYHTHKYTHERKSITGYKESILDIMISGGYQ